MVSEKKKNRPASSVSPIKCESCGEPVGACNECGETLPDDEYLYCGEDNIHFCSTDCVHTHYKIKRALATN